MSWETITAWLDILTNNPTFIAVAGVLTTAGSVLVFLSKTSVGKRAIIKFDDLSRNALKTAADTLEKVTSVEKLANDTINSLKADYEQKVNDLTAFYEEKTTALVSIVNFYEETLFSITSLIPNKKVQEKLADIKMAYENKKKEIVEVVGNIYQDFDMAVEEARKQTEIKYVDKINFLESEIAKMSLFLNELKVEDINNDNH